MIERARSTLAALLLFSLASCAPQEATLTEAHPLTTASPSPGEVTPLLLKTEIASPVSMPTNPASSPTLPAPALDRERRGSEESAKIPPSCSRPIPGWGSRMPRISLDELVEQARQHLAECLGVPVEAVQVILVEKANWEGPGLNGVGPPFKSPDRAYAGPISGYRIVLAVAEVYYEYRIIGSRLIFCGLPAP